MPDSDWEVEFRRRRFAQLRAAYDQSPDRVDEEQVEQHRAIERPKVIAFLDAFKANGDLEGCGTRSTAGQRPPAHILASRARTARCTSTS